MSQRTAVVSSFENSADTSKIWLKCRYALGLYPKYARGELDAREKDLTVAKSCQKTGDKPTGFVGVRKRKKKGPSLKLGPF